MAEGFGFQGKNHSSIRNNVGPRIRQMVELREKGVAELSEGAR